jgi:lysyl-tRNA synthetase class 2
MNYSQSWWLPHNYAAKRATLEERQRIIRAIRAYFDGDGFNEVETPILQISPGNEAHLHAFRTQFHDPHGGAGRDYYLHTSPEFTMKKLLVAGEEKIFQFARVFRNAEQSSRHHPEFTMLEWYRAGGSLDDIKRDCVAVVQAALSGHKTEGSGNGYKGAENTRGASRIPHALIDAWENLTVADAFARYAAIDLMATIDDDRAPQPDKLAAAAQARSIRVAEGDSWEDLFFRIMGEMIEPRLGFERPTLLCDYPVSMAALSRPKADNPRLAERFELYINGIELANAFGELTDADEQLRRFQADMDLKEKLYGERYPIDMDFIAALRHGMPPASGIALGLDRLVMLAAGTEQIEDVLWAPVAVSG